ncbi:hypothetical protein AA103196_0648 [Ameyamaea chiangmaiensis NBRC 103196]|uniref:Uncharacterized protein n=1 Tax=Ameyamaea chiangmaiensis TaxID=442969 RepID=A0A850P7J2_9PROT|nr:hypothetical protein [Ameyamaea chiangmaiensis]MBS4076607.1 hypothetical protein [Ameyamaea chiangmaiensis]NVN39898.1 hypothetical protein [Ameyamaea chiangmaiensis]GBQ63616.1 hypothetical protein AA103196_0648 [Ameyamaea chiangmaiensis NBRC 103196]
MNAGGVLLKNRAFVIDDNRGAGAALQRWIGGSHWAVEIGAGSLSSSIVRLTLYGLIVAIDIDLRRLVQDQLGNNRNIEEILAPELLSKVRDRAARDGLIEDSDVYDYLDFPDSVKTLRRHKAELDSTFARFVQKNSADLDRLTPIRNRVMHGRPLQFTDFAVVDEFVQKIRGFPAR